VQRGEVGERFQPLPDLVVDEDGRGVLGAAVDDPVSGGVHRAE
jgi:hypothetical protein